MDVKAYNTQTVGAPLSSLAVSVNAGGTALYVKNINAFSVSHAIQLGKTGEELAEIKMLGLTTPSGTTLNTTGTITFDHPADTPVYDIKFDQLIFKRSTSGTAGTATALTGGTVSIKPDELFTSFDDTSGATTYAYKASYRNSVTGEVSSDSDWLAPSGYTFYSRIELRNRLKNKLFNAGYIKEDSVIDEWMNEWLEVMNNAAVKVNEEYSINTVDVGFGTAGLGTITAADFKRPVRIWVTYDGTNYGKSSRIPLRDVIPNATYSRDDIKHTYKGDAKFQILPANNGGTARIDYATLITPLASDTDELPVVMRSYSKSFIDYGLSQAYYMDGKDTLGKIKMDDAAFAKQDFINEITPRDDTGPQYITFDAPLTGDSSSLDYYEP